MNNSKKLFIYGTGNPEIIRLVKTINKNTKKWSSVYFIDDDEKKIGKEIFCVSVVGDSNFLNTIAPDDSELIVYIARDMRIRSEAIKRVEKYGIPYASLVHPDVIMDDIKVGEDVIIYWGTNISPYVSIGNHSIICMGSVIAHECTIGECVFISPGAILNSRILVGNGTFIGANAAILPEVKIGSWAVIGAGSVVTKDVSDGETVFGNPARVMFKR